MLEERLENWLLDNVALELDKCECNWKLTAAKAKKPQKDRESILRKIDRLKDLYVDGFITKDQYRADYEKYKADLADASGEPEPLAPDFAKLRQALSQDFRSAYSKLDRPSRRSFWHGIISKIELSAQNEPVLFFNYSFTILV